MNEYKKKQMDINANQKLRQNETNGDQCGSKIEAKTNCQKVSLLFWEGEDQTLRTEAKVGIGKR